MRKVQMSIEVLSAKIGFCPPPQGKRAQNEKTVHNQQNILKINTLPRGGGRIFMDKRLCAHLGASDLGESHKVHQSLHFIFWVISSFGCDDVRLVLYVRIELQIISDLQVHQHCDSAAAF